MYSLPSRKIFRCGRCHIRLDLPILSAWEVFAKSWVYFLYSLWDGSILDHVICRECIKLRSLSTWQSREHHRSNRVHGL